jgi:transcription elongation factor GreA
MLNLAFSDGYYDKLKQHLDAIKSKKDDMIDRYFPELNAERYDFMQLMDDYIKQLGELLQQNCDTPFVIIGSTVKVQDIDDDYTITFTLVCPHESNPVKGCISYLSPIGKSLLLRKAGEIVNVVTPNGEVRYEILEIKI